MVYCVKKSVPGGTMMELTEEVTVYIPPIPCTSEQGLDHLLVIVIYSTYVAIA